VVLIVELWCLHGHKGIASVGFWVHTVTKPLEPGAWLRCIALTTL
jgi:hypothetical protein